MNSTISNVSGQNTVSIEKASNKLMTKKKLKNDDDSFMNTLTSMIGTNINDSQNENKTNVNDNKTKDLSININVRISKSSSDPNSYVVNQSVGAGNVKGDLASDSTGKASNPVSSNNDSTVKNSKSIKISVNENNGQSIKDTINDTENDIVNEVKDVIKEALDVSDEDIENAMSTLGITIQDLLNPKDLASLFMVLTGNVDADVSSIITDSSFNDILSKLNDLSSEILSLGDTEGVALTGDFELVNQDEISEAIKSLKDIINGDINPSNAKEILVTVSNEASTENKENADDIQTLAVDENADSTANENVSIVDDVENINQNTDDSENTNTNSKNESKNFGDKNSFSLENTLLKNDNTLGQNSFSNLSTSIVDNITSAIDNLSYRSGIDARDIISQIVSKAHTTLSDTVKSMEMELNPQSLGKMIMKVSETAGTVSAHITVQNENVKEALTNQMALLKTNLESQGMKVQEVTITANPHEFERNLEEGQNLPENFTQNENAENNGYSEKEGSNKNRRGVGSLNLSDMSDDDFSGLNNDEMLAARIMKDNGNRMNIRA